MPRPKLSRKIMIRLANYNFIAADHTQHAAHLFVQQIKVEIVIRQAKCQVFHPSNFELHLSKLHTKVIVFSINFGASEQPIVTLQGCKSEIDAQAESR